LALRASLAERALLQGRFDARPCLSKLKWPSLAISPWQNPLSEATLKGHTESKETAEQKLKKPGTGIRLCTSFPCSAWERILERQYYP